MNEYYQGQPYVTSAIDDDSYWEDIAAKYPRSTARRDPTPGVCRETGDIIDRALCPECESYRERKCDGVATDTSNGTVTIETGDQVDLSDIRPSGPALSDRRATTEEIADHIDRIIEDLVDLRNKTIGYDLPF